VEALSLLLVSNSLSGFDFADFDGRCNGFVQIISTA
jgi:hypothetical protein